MKHSPAPWERFGDEIYAADGTRIAEAVTMVDVPLLTKAPRLLAALSRLVELEDMRLRQLHEMGRGTDYADHHRLLSLAWAEAREALRMERPAVAGRVDRSVRRHWRRKANHVRVHERDERGA